MESLAVSVWGLKATVVRLDVKRHFAEVLPGCQPKVSPLVPSGEPGFQATTVSFLCDSGKEGRRTAVAALQDKPLEDEQNEISVLGVSESFLGVTVLAQSRPDPAFDFYFIHGLGGHAYKTFNFKRQGHQKTCMWPRDLMPEMLERSGYFGRYSTFGYPADEIKGSGITSPIEQTAEELLTDIESSRPRAMVMIMEGKRSRNTPDDFRDVFAPSGECLVKGILFFGTPFKGSVLADIFGPVAVILGKNTTNLARLKTYDKQVNDMLQTFDDLRLKYSIPLVAFYEKNPVKKFITVTKHESAVGSFKKGIRRVAIYKDHREMCKFRNSQDRDFSKSVAPQIRRLVKGVVAEGMLEFGIPETGGNPLSRQKLDLPPPSSGPHGQHDNDQLRLFHNQRENDLQAPARDMTSFNDPNKAPSFMVIANNLKLYGSPRSLKGVRKALPGTCDWVLEKDLYKSWQDSPHDAVLFIRGGQGLGKSVLSRFITEHLEDVHQADSALVVHFFCKASGRKSSPISILRHILYTLCEKFPGDINRLAKNLANVLGQRLNVNFYWDLFLSLKNAVQFQLFCVIDGLDECIQDAKDEGDDGIDETLVEFLGKLCQELKENPEKHSTRVKVLFTTRPIREVARATEGVEGIVLDIQSTDTAASVAAMVDADVRALAIAKNLTPETEDLIKIDLKVKAGPMFQWAHAVLQTLWKYNFNIDPFEAYERVLEEYRPGDIDQPYYDALRSIRDDRMATPADKTMIATMLRILVFSEIELTLEDIQYALASLAPESSPERFEAHIPRSLASTISSSCGGLVVVEGSCVRLAHQSVRMFLLQLSPSDWPEFSCKEIESGHRLLAFICLQFLLIWHRLEVPKADLGLSESRKLAILAQNPFVDYASSFWDCHVRKAGDLKPLWGLLRIFLNDEFVDFKLMQGARRFHLGLDSIPWDSTLVSNFLAGSDLMNVIKDSTFEGQGYSKRRCLRWLRFRSQPKPGPLIDIHAVDSDGYTMLHLAAQNGSLEMVNYLLRRGARGDAWNAAGETPFWNAVAGGHEEVALRLLELGEAEDEITSSDRMSSLQFATCFGMESVLMDLLDRGAQVDQGNGYYGWTPLYVAAQYDHRDIVALLLLRGADPEKPATDGATPLHAAAGSGNLEVLQQLFDAKKGLDPAPVAGGGWTPLLEAARNGHLETFKFLLAKQPSVRPTNRGWLPAHAAASSGNIEIVRCFSKADNSVPDNNGYLPIHIAAQEGHEKIVRFYIDQTIDPNTKAKDHQAESGMTDKEVSCITPIYLAIESGYVDVVGMLLEHDVDIYGKDTRGRSLLHVAAAWGDNAHTSLLQDRGLDPLERDVLGFTPWHVAALRGHAALVGKLLQELRGRLDFQVDLTTGNNMTSLELALAEGHAGVVDILLAAEASPHRASGGFGESSVLIAAKHPTLLNRLLELGVDHLKPDMYGSTPLLRAASQGCLDSVKLLLDRGADVNSQSVLGDTPSSLAAINSHHAILEELLLRGANMSLRDNIGRSAIDYVGETSPVWDQLSAHRAGDAPLERAEQEAVIRSTIREILNCQNFRPKLGPHFEWPHFAILAHEFTQLREEVEARICFEYGLCKMYDGTVRSELRCRICETNRFEDPIHVCWKCYQRLVCHECYLKRPERDPFDDCPLEHTYFEIAGEEWRNLPKGKVNQSGQTMDEWMRDLRAKYGADEPTETGPTGTGQQNQVDPQVSEVQDDPPAGIPETAPENQKPEPPQPIS